MNVRILHDGSFIRPGGSARVARELARALDAPVTVGHTVDREFWNDVDANFAFQNEFHNGFSGRGYDYIPKHYAEFRVGQRFRELDFEEDILLSTSTMSKWIVPKYHQAHINYCHVPPPHFYAIPKRGVINWAKSLGLGIIDQHFTTFVDQILANSEFTRKRVRRHYRTDPPVLHPPVRVKEFYHFEPADPPYFVMVCRLVPMKRPELVARAFANMDTDVRLIVVGSGPLQATLEQYRNVDVKTGLSDEEVEDVIARSVGGIAFAELEHCGITPKEFQAAGKPVIVPDEPNLRNHVVDGDTGVVTAISEAGIRNGIARVLNREWNPNRIREVAESWSQEAFGNRARELLQEVIDREE
ncbi:glycosyltransferase [Haloterrigena salifodinae]|uniref:Glycosyltransferase n=1 Tax=Haloterrigena salifodinae TaxID=2675099 RepID=A0A8T8DXJ8_9EURY|nr:glycosyltransferase [Haloterrigena salifodinae]QRV13991.1 glycosyltransferase [Haloterrigena salifodinae]